MTSCLTASHPEYAAAPVLTPPPPTTPHHMAMVVLETASRSRTALRSPTVQWMGTGGRGLHLDPAPSPVGRGSSCQSGHVISQPLNTAVVIVLGRAPSPVPVTVRVQLTGSGPAGPVGANVPPPASEIPTDFQPGLATALVLTLPPHPFRPVKVAQVMPVKSRPVPTCLPVQWMEGGAPGLPSHPVLLPVGWAFRCQSGNVTAPPSNMVDVRVSELKDKP